MIRRGFFLLNSRKRIINYIPRFLPTFFYPGVSVNVEQIFTFITQQKKKNYSPLLRFKFIDINTRKGETQRVYYCIILLCSYRYNMFYHKSYIFVKIVLYFYIFIALICLFFRYLVNLFRFLTHIFVQTFLLIPVFPRT